MARRIDREALGHVVRGRSARIDPADMTTVASVQLASARCGAAALEQLADHDNWRSELQTLASDLMADDPLSAMLFFAVGVGEALVALPDDRTRAATILTTVLAAGAVNAAASADLVTALECARSGPPPVRPSGAARRRAL